MHALAVNPCFPLPVARCRLRQPKGGVMTKKRVRQAAILDLVSAHVVGSQEDLRLLLAGRGMDVTQATLSRDLRDLGLARVADENGARYVVPESLTDNDDKPLLANLLPQLFSKIDGVGEMIVLHTVRSGAQPIAEAIDQEEFDEVLGTIAGDDTILIVTRSAEARIVLTRRLVELSRDA
jgi:transcriptional regulator of arginine metabolism